MKFKSLDEEKIVSLKKKSNFLLPVPGGSLMISILRGSNPRTMEYECGISWDDLAKILEAHGIDKKEIAKIPRQYMGDGYSLNSVAQYLNKVTTGKNAADALMVAWGEWNKAIKTSDGIRFEEKETDEMRYLKEANEETREIEIGKRKVTFVKRGNSWVVEKYDRYTVFRCIEDYGFREELPEFYVSSVSDVNAATLEKAANEWKKKAEQRLKENYDAIMNVIDDIEDQIK